MIIRRCVLETEQSGIMEKGHASPYGGHFVGDKIVKKILQSGFYWPTLCKDCFEWVKHCDTCQRMGNISRRTEMSLQGILVVQIFYVCVGDRLHGTFPIIIWKYIHFPSYGLCIQTAGSDRLP